MESRNFKRFCEDDANQPRVANGSNHRLTGVVLQERLTHLRTLSIREVNPTVSSSAASQARMLAK
jgi:hypothetical protein